MIMVVLIVLGLCFGSFVNAFVWRLHEQSKKQKDQVADKKKLSILRGRSMCPDCKHELTAIDLLPILSWLSLKGKCRYCHKSISWQYPIVEASTALLFVLSYKFWPFELNSYQNLYFGMWLVCLVGFMALVIYDIRWMLLPNKVIFPLYGLAGAMTVVLMLDRSSLEPLWRALVGVLIGGGIFYLLFQVSSGKWIGGGDVKLGFLLGAIVGGPSQAFLVLFLASLLGSMTSIPLILSKKVDKGTRIPFGPFLIIATVIVMLWGADMSQWYIDTFVGGL